jgi:hypothetical protein
VRGFADFYQRFFRRDTPRKRPPDTGLTSIRVAKLGKRLPRGSPPPTKSVIYAALGLPPGDPLDFPDTALAMGGVFLPPPISHHVRAQASGKIASRKIVCSCERVRRFLSAIFSVRHPRKKNQIVVDNIVVMVLRHNPQTTNNVAEPRLHIPYYDWPVPACSLNGFGLIEQRVKQEMMGVQHKRRLTSEISHDDPLLAGGVDPLKERIIW